MSSRSPNHQMTWFNLIPTKQRVGLTLTDCTTQSDGVYSPTDLYLNLEHKEANTSFIFSHFSAIQSRQMKTTQNFVHMKGGFFSTKVEEGER